MGWNNWCPDCIHLKACRRMQKILRGKGIWGVSRGCNTECTAYISGQIGEYVPVDEAVDYAISGVSSIRSGYDPLDVYYSGDLNTKTLGELVDETDKKLHPGGDSDE